MAFSTIVADLIRKLRARQAREKGQALMQETTAPAAIREATLCGELQGDWMNRTEVRLSVLRQLREQFASHKQRAEDLDAQAEGMNAEAGKSRIAMYRLGKLIAALEEFNKEDDDESKSPL